ncbi:MAG: UDP-N-acetylmuramoyl-L-alanyl-D-glutamate--2,6-diaminopimelate ligase [Anaerolineales bacterium]|nr:UDP-N-acetylmuramoyl-L-alanyl-D-glutamate--2,6-diaminopimelate ligase [Anaerolineales bacterium]
MSPVLLSDLFSSFPFPHQGLNGVACSVSAVTADSRQVKPGALFVACTGGTADGHGYIPDAITKGAAAVVGEQPLAGLAVPYIQVENSRQALAYLAAAFYGYPARKLTMIGVTGTDGKTTTTNLIYQILLTAGIKAGMISTVNAVIGDQVLDTGFHVTTPDAPDVQRYLSLMVDAGLTHVILETTSHGWAQHRVDACEFDIGVVTNITHEHLDYHGSYEAYRAAKARLFQSLAETQPKPQGNPRLAVLNRDDASYPYLVEVLRASNVERQTSIENRKSAIVNRKSYGLGEGADVRAENIVYDASGFQFTIMVAQSATRKNDEQRVAINSKLIGAFNISNCLAALTAAVAGLGIDPETAARGIAAFPGIPGRMERIELGQPFTAIVDFAHTPNALRVALQTAREMLLTAESAENAEKNQMGSANSVFSAVKKGRLIAVFGSAGLRDREKRRMMAEVSAELADITVLTAEDPRTESLDDILEEMAAGARLKGGVEGKTFFRVPDRGEAIRFGVRLAQEGDIVIACGKGHEQSMCFGEVEYPWDDRIAMRAALSELVGVEGPQMPYLPTQDV